MWHTPCYLIEKPVHPEQYLSRKPMTSVLLKWHRTRPAAPRRDPEHGRSQKRSGSCLIERRMYLSNLKRRKTMHKKLIFLILFGLLAAATFTGCGPGRYFNGGGCLVSSAQSPEPVGVSQIL